ncbi:MAG TPA: hypothetical protein PKD45_05050, partial [Flavobacteriales bacterium]|nr:hypothetical protein [Flavobacteriales bacterium]
MFSPSVGLSDCVYELNPASMVTIIKKKTPKSRLRAAVKQARKVPQKGFDARKHLGKWKLDEDALETQKRLRDEWG